MNYPKVLIIDDNPNDRTLALREIEKLFPQFQYWEVIDEADFSKALQQPEFNIVITDYQLRWTTGLDILRRIKQQMPQCPVIMFTGTGSEEIAVEAMKSGLDDYVLKSPKHYIRLAAAVRSAWQRSQQQQALQEIQATYDRFFNRVPLGLYRLDPSGNIIEANSTLSKIFGYQSKKDLEGQNIADFHLQPETYSEWQQQLQESTANQEYEALICNQQARLIWVRHNTVAIKDKAGKIACYEGALADITANKKAELERIDLIHRERQAKQEAEKLNRIKDEFLATLSHELRTPLNSIIGWLQLIRNGKLNEAQFRRAIETIDRNAKMQNQLIEDLLDVSRIIRGTLKLQLEAGNLVEVLLSSIDTVRPTAEAKQIQIKTQLESDNVRANIDSERLQQIFWNLLTNAIKFTPLGGKVIVEAVTTSDTVKISISDTGQGIDGDTLPYVFDRFRQAETKSSTRTQGGLGLGLAIVRHLVEAHGGRVTADSAGLGKGATFTVQLPLLNNHSFLQQQDETSEEELLPSLAGITLLLVEDEADAREMVTLILSQYGACVITADSVQTAWQRYQQHQPDLIVSDISMPKEDGYSLIRRIRSSQEDNSTPAIALTAYAREEDKQQAIEAGFDLHLPKPIEPYRLVRGIISLIEIENKSDL